MDDTSQAATLTPGPVARASGAADTPCSTPIEDYALIDNLETAALVDRAGSIDWLCWPRFDSAACFARLLGTEQNGFWRLWPSQPVRHATRRYRPGTLILETVVETDTGAARLLDFMPLREVGCGCFPVRMVQGIRGQVELAMALALRFDFGQIVPWVRSGGHGVLKAAAGPDAVRPVGPVALTPHGLQTHAQVTVTAADELAFVLSWYPSHEEPPPPLDAAAALDLTVGWWQDWISRCRYRGPWREAVERSLITIKAMTFRPSGGIVAAPTTSLPECPGGERNWDYRFCWLRDAVFTVSSLVNCGYTEEAEAWRHWLLRAVAGSPGQLQPLYGILRERRIDEWEGPWLAGHGGARPVRVGNAAKSQLQLDILSAPPPPAHRAAAHAQ